MGGVAVDELVTANECGDFDGDARTF